MVLDDPRTNLAGIFRPDDRPFSEWWIQPKRFEGSLDKENNVEDRQKIREWIRFACECNEVPELAQVVLVEWNGRFTLRLGDATTAGSRCVPGFA